jgi:hypothetical protein
MIVALVADRLLQAQDSAAQKKIAELLAADKSNTWTKTDIASEATWADVLLEKSPEGRAATAKWHYVKLDVANPDVTKACFGKPALPSMAPASRGLQDDCVVDKIEQFAKELRDPATLSGERLMALQFVLNFVGDVHDPLYVIEHNDHAGRCAALMLMGAKTPVRLSAYWDDVLVAEALGKDPVKAAGQIVAGLTPANIAKWSGGSPADWARESYDLAKDVTYSFAKEAPKDPAHMLSLPQGKGSAAGAGLPGRHQLSRPCPRCVKEQLQSRGAAGFCYARTAMRIAAADVGITACAAGAP